MNNDFQEKIDYIRPYITYFSEELKHKATHEEEVVVGGVITSIIPPLEGTQLMNILIVDDFVGVSHVHVPDSMMDHYSNKLKIGNHVFIEGFVNVVNRQVKKEKKKDVSIFAYGLKDITDHEESAV